MFVFKKENQIFWILCEAWVLGSLSASKITCGHLCFKSTKGSYVEILLNGITGTWLPRNGLYPAQVDTYSELGMLRCEHHVLTPFWELTYVYLVSWGQQTWMRGKERDSGPEWSRSGSAPLFWLGLFLTISTDCSPAFLASLSDGHTVSTQSWPHETVLRPPAYTSLAGLLSQAPAHWAAALCWGS